MSRRPRHRDPWAAYRTPPDRKAVPYLDRLRDAARAAPPARRELLLDHLMTVMLTADLVGHPGIEVGLRAARNRELLLRKARQMKFDEQRGKPLEEFAQSNMRGVALDDGSPAVEFYAKLK
jgi:hypothetical protein